MFCYWAFLSSFLTWELSIWGFFLKCLQDSGTKLISNNILLLPAMSRHWCSTLSTFWRWIIETWSLKGGFWIATCNNRQNVPRNSTQSHCAGDLHIFPEPVRCSCICYEKKLIICTEVYLWSNSVYLQGKGTTFYYPEGIWNKCCLRLPFQWISVIKEFTFSYFSSRPSFIPDLFPLYISAVSFRFLTACRWLDKWFPIPCIFQHLAKMLNAAQISPCSQLFRRLSLQLLGLVPMGRGVDEATDLTWSLIYDNWVIFRPNRV